MTNPPQRRTATSRLPSMADVAALAKVSSQTVSRVVNGRTNVDDDTRERVLAAMGEAGYRPNSAARSLKSGQFRSIGVVLYTLSTFGNMRTLDAVTASSTLAGYSVTLLPVALDTEDGVASAVTRLAEQAVDGIVIIMEAQVLDRASITLPTGVPVVIVDSDAGSQFTVVDTDQVDGARQATQHLLDLGHTTVWHVAGPDAAFSARRRAASWRATLEEAGTPVPPPLVGDWSGKSGYQHGLTLAARKDVTAIFAANDQMALGILRALHESGRAVPQSVSVIGFDDMPDADSFYPPLTTVHQDFGEVGRLCMVRLLELIESNRPHPGATLVPAHLVLRSSTASPSRRD
ncbi:LacI family DNA-binding transcriptional regulator [Cryobacterium sp. TMT2-4]|uniref:LacI family DNA-binding transcriptional regulator n=1 Tax=Cryobacterium sp. TMT2-4 TaxID=1259254 RepID=UPI001F540DF6|nr:LacI family DNA-binding transcriptional regulator [Cryobacterium sp. TMT2-4]